MQGEPTWIYVVGEGRSGSTLLGSLLSRTLDGFDCGELHLLWESLVDGRVCSCGTEVASCRVWSEVARLARSELGLPDNGSGARIMRRRLRQRDLLAPRIPKPHADELALRGATERAVQEVTGASVLVDTSKLSSVLWTAAQLERPLTVVHLVRDPRAVAFSWGRPTADPSRRGQPLPTKSPWRASVDWLRANVTTSRIVRRRGMAWIRVRYEDLATEPESVHEAVLDAAHLQSMARTPADVTELHALAGNPKRHGPQEIRIDLRWHRQMRVLDRVIATALASPLLHRYGYALVPRSAPPTRRGRRSRSGTQ